MTLHAATRRFLRHLEANGCSRHTVRSYACDLRGLAQYSGARKSVKAITAHDLTRVLTSDEARLTKSGLPKGPGAMNRMRSVLRSFFRWLIETGQVSRNPAATLRTNAYKKPVPKTLDERDRRKLLRALETSRDPLAVRDRVLVELMLATGVRLAEAVSLDADDLDLKNRTMTICPKGGGEQSRYLNTRVRRLLRTYSRWRSERNGHDPALFITCHGDRISLRHVQRRFKVWSERAGLDRPISPHVLRHTLAVRLLDQTGNLRLVQQALGHRSIASTIRYTTVSDHVLARALESI